MLTLCDSAWHGGLASGYFVCGLDDLGARQCWLVVMIICSAKHWVGWC